MVCIDLNNFQVDFVNVKQHLDTGYITKYITNKLNYLTILFIVKPVVVHSSLMCNRRRSVGAKARHAGELTSYSMSASDLSTSRADVDAF